MESINDRVETVPIDRLHTNPRNARRGNIDAIRNSIEQHGWYGTILARIDTGEIIAGNHRFLAAQEAGATEVPVTWVDVDDERALHILLADNRTNDLAGYDNQTLLEILLTRLETGTLDGTGYTEEQVNELLAEHGPPDLSKLGEPMEIAPYAVLDARAGEWMERKRAWLSLGIQSELGRDGKLIYNSPTAYDPAFYNRKNALEEKLGRQISTAEFLRDHYTAPTEGSGIGKTGTSVFDPVLCELAYRWFSTEGATILDPFAGGSVRGVVAATLGREYLGMELRGEQVEANRQQAAGMILEPAPRWEQGDSRTIAERFAGEEADLLFTCPPYVDLEVYSDDPADISNMDYSEFRETYREIIARSVSLLKPDRFAAIVVGESRDKRGNYYGFVQETINAFEAAGLRYRNNAIILTPMGGVPTRARRQFVVSRKVGKTHQNLLTFVKGSIRKAVEYANRDTDPEE